MSAHLTFFPVGNGDMALVTLDNEQTILIDINIRTAADNENDDTSDVAEALRERLKKDADGRTYVDVMLLSHPDGDHCTGLKNHFHLGPLSDWVKKENKIIIREMWSSPIVFKRASKDHVLCDDAKAWAAEARRRVALFRKEGLTGTPSGERILIMGEDVDGKTDNIPAIVVKVDELIQQADRGAAGKFQSRLLAPLPLGDEEEEETLSKNNSSVIMRLSIMADGFADKCGFLTGGDADVAIWDRLWQKHGDAHPSWLEYDILEAPHHCSWRTLSFDRWSELGEKVTVNLNARSALSQRREGAVVVASCKPIKADDDNPPHERAKREYVSIVDEKSDRFFCTGEYPSEKTPEPLEFIVTRDGPEKKRRAAKVAAVAAFGIGGIAQTARAHGKR